MFKIFNRNRDFKDEFFYLENKALKLYKKSKYKRSFEYYNKLLKASEDFKNNSAEKHFKWYDEVLAPCLKKYCDNYDEFFKHLFLVDMELMMPGLIKQFYTMIILSVMKLLITAINF